MEKNKQLISRSFRWVNEELLIFFVDESKWTKETISRMRIEIGFRRFRRYWNSSRCFDDAPCDRVPFALWEFPIPECQTRWLRICVSLMIDKNVWQTLKISLILVLVQCMLTMRPLCLNRRTSPNTRLLFRWETVWDRATLRRPMPSRCTNAGVRVSIREPAKCCADCIPLRCLAICMCLSLRPACGRPPIVLCKWRKRPAYQLALVCHCSIALQPWPPERVEWVIKERFSGVSEALRCDASLTFTKLNNSHRTSGPSPGSAKQTNDLTIANPDNSADVLLDAFNLARLNCNFLHDK